MQIRKQLVDQALQRTKTKCVCLFTRTKPVRRRPVAAPGLRRHRIRLPPHGALGAAGLGKAQVVQLRQALQPPVAEYLTGAPQHRAGSRTAHLVANLVDLGQQARISTAV